MSDTKNDVQGPSQVTATPDQGEAASVAQRIDQLRQQAQNGELGDEFLEEVAGGNQFAQIAPHTNGTIHTNGAHTNGTIHTNGT
jgi:hypothetical protein